jgi:two-component system alkaline phosphatase synthesis response regulator PhoP
MDSENIKILLVDDEPDILELVGYHLKKEGFQVKTAHNGFEALDIADDFMPHLILLDIMMPEMDGMETCEKIRSSEKLKNVLIVFFTARGEDYSQVAGFDAGADDYITKPIKPRVLVSKVKALLRRLGTSVEHEEDVLEFNDFTIFKNEYYVLKNGEQIVLPKKEFDLLVLLASSPNKVLNREHILRNVWGHDVVVGGRTIDVHIRKLREKIGDRYIDTIKGVGYKFID